MLQQITKNIVSLAFLQILAKVFIYIFIIIITRSLGPELMGVYGYFFNLIMILDVLIDYGMTPFMVKAIARNREDSRIYFFLPLWIKYALAILSSSIIGIYASFIETDPVKQNVYIEIIFVLFTWPLFNSVISLFQAYERQDLYGIAYIFRNGFLILFTFPLLLLGLSVEAPFIGYALAPLVSALIALVWIYKRFFSTRGRLLASEITSFTAIKSLVRQGIPFFAKAIVTALYMRIDVIILLWIRGDFETGLFKTSQQTLEGLTLFNFVVGNTIFPVLSRIAGTHSDQFKIILVKSIKFLLLLGFPVSVLFTAAGKEIISIFYGIEQFSGSVITLQILVWQYIPFFINYISLYALYALDKQKQVFIINSIGLIFKISLFSLLSAKMGYIGGCWAVVISECVLTIIYLISAQKSLHYSFFHSDTIRIFIAAVFMFVSTIIVDIFGSIWIAVFEGFIVYGGCIFIFRAVSAEELRSLYTSVFHRKTIE
jgi:O-antigen/teichoic acid export membrane protein